ncbi:MAG TPA: DUF1592 domain-containing protein, partial [Myxococcaceae bacterium]|nr:DUF1592 domain-containing protein [Myxococcaceae bacterium]
MRKLTGVQYRNTLRDLIAGLVGSADEAGAVLTSLNPVLARYPKDEHPRIPQDPHGSYRRMDQALQQDHVDASYTVALAAAAQLTTPSRLGRVAGACATDGDSGNDAGCLTDFIRRFGAQAFRRPLDAEEVEFFQSTYGVSGALDAETWGRVVSGILTAPEFLYLMEHGEEPIPGNEGAFALSGYELATRLSYQFWETLPDAELLEAARTGALKTSAGYTAQVDRLLADPRAQATVDAFFEDYLKLHEVAVLDRNNADAVFQAFAGEDLPGPNLRKGMIDDVVDMMRHYTWDQEGSLDDVLTSNLSFARGEDLANIYGVPVWDGRSAPPSFPAGQRPGLLTRAAFLATGLPTTRPIMKGVFLRTNILCDNILVPPNN